MTSSWNRRESHAWYRITDDDIYSYQYMLNARLGVLHDNQNLFQCNDLKCRKTEHLNAITYYCVSVVNICIDAGTETFPKCSPQKHLKPYWSEMIPSHKDCFLFWHSIWLDNGKPQNGIIAQITKTIFLYAGQRHIKLDYDGHAWLRMSHMIIIKMMIIWRFFWLSATHDQVINIKSLHRNRWCEHWWEYCLIICEILKYI